jgi:hypothetical protein
MLLACEAIFGRERGAKIIARVEEATGQACPCKQGLPCPIAPPMVPTQRGDDDVVAGKAVELLT